MIYDFMCNSCGNIQEEKMKLKEYETLEELNNSKILKDKCECSGTMVRKPVAPMFTLKINPGDVAGWAYSDYDAKPPRPEREE